MKKILIISLLFSVTALFAQSVDKKFGYRGYIGGMFLHTGYVESRSFAFTDRYGGVYSQKLQGMPVGIGGHLKVMLSDFLRVGTEGYTTRLNYENQSYAAIGWGGFLADIYRTVGRFTPYIGSTVGGGAFRHLRVFQPIENDFIADETVAVRSYRFMCVTPFAGLEYKLTERISAVVKTDYMINLTNNQQDFTRGFRIYCGVSFKNSK